MDSSQSGCSTLLKTLAGEMNGIYMDDASHLNYQGKDRSTVPVTVMNRLIDLNLTRYPGQANAKSISR